MKKTIAMWHWELDPNANWWQRIFGREILVKDGTFEIDVPEKK